LTLLATHCVILKILANYVKERSPDLNFYFFWYFISIVLCLINNGMQLYLMNFFLGNILPYGISIYQFTSLHQNLRRDPLVEIFPRIIQCTYFRYSSSGKVETFSSICQLPLNDMTEKIFLIIWFCILILFCITVVYVVCLLMIIVIPPLRWVQFGLGSTSEFKNNIKNVQRNSNINQWFIIFLLYKNVEFMFFEKFISQLSAKMVKSQVKETSC
jgi:hypothetical protein